MRHGSDDLLGQAEASSWVPGERRSHHFQSVRRRSTIDAGWPQSLARFGFFPHTRTFLGFWTRRVFELEPQARSLFHFTIDEDIQSNPQFRIHAAAMVDMIDMAVSFLGPDLDPLQEDLIELGRRHVRYGVPLEYLPVMERAVTYMLDELLVTDGGMSRSERQSWQVVFHFMIRHMTAGMKL